MKIKCAIFDFDGTLFDSMFVWERAGEMYLRSIGANPKPNLNEEIKTLSLYQTACYFKKEYRLTCSPEEIMDDINKIVEHFYFNDVLPKAGVVEFVERIRKLGVRTCIATATDRYQIEAALKRCSMEHCFDAIFTCGEVGHGKDEPVIFQKAMHFFGADRTTTIVFEDAVHAAKTAKADGFTVAAVYDGSENCQEELRKTADFYLTDFEHTEELRKFASV